MNPRPRRKHLGKAAEGIFSCGRKVAIVSVDHCRAAIAALDRALDDRPDKIYHVLAEVVRCLVGLRTELTMGRRQGELADRLERRNAVLAWSLAASTQWLESAKTACRRLATNSRRYSVSDNTRRDR
jgi:hypothetical protein